MDGLATGQSKYAEAAAVMNWLQQCECRENRWKNYTEHFHKNVVKKLQVSKRKFGVSLVILFGSLDRLKEYWKCC